MSIPQAKGLEFDDVLLYNFFADSPAKDAWRVLCTYLDELQTKVGDVVASTASSSSVLWCDGCVGVDRRCSGPAGYQVALFIIISFVYYNIFCLL